MISIWSNLAKNGQYPEELQSSRKIQEDSRIDGILEFRIENHVLGQKMNGKGTLDVEIGKKLAISRQYPDFQKRSDLVSKRLSY